MSLDIRLHKSALSGAQLTSTCCVTHACGIPCNTSRQCRLPCNTCHTYTCTLILYRYGNVLLFCSIILTHRHKDTESKSSNSPVHILYFVFFSTILLPSDISHNTITLYIHNSFTYHLIYINRFLTHYIPPLIPLNATFRRDFCYFDIGSSFYHSMTESNIIPLHGISQYPLTKSNTVQ